jgi:hypothetical protein
MNTTKKLISTLITGATLLAAAPVFADSYRDRSFDHDRHSTHYRDFDRHGYRDHDRHYYDRRHVVVVQRPYIVEQPVYYSQPAPNYGIGAIIGQAIGTIYDSRQ